MHIDRRVDRQCYLIIAHCQLIPNACKHCADGVTRLEDLLGRLRSLTQGAVPAAATATAAVARALPSSVLGPAVAGVAMVIGVAVGVPRLVRWRHPARRTDIEV